MRHATKTFFWWYSSSRSTWRHFMVCGRMSNEVFGEGKRRCECGIRPRSFVPEEVNQLCSERKPTRWHWGIRPNKNYIPKLVEMFNLETKRSKQVPRTTPTWKSFEELDKNNEKLRKWIACPSGLGLLAVRTLLSYSAKPTANPLSWFRHLLWYLKGAEEHGVSFEDNEQAVAADRWPVEDAFRNRELSSEVMVEVFADSNWAGCAPRKSTTSRCICRWKPGAKQLQEADEPSVEFMWGRTFGSVEFSCGDQAGDKFGEVLHERWGWQVRCQQHFTLTVNAKTLMLHRGCPRLKHLDVRYLCCKAWFDNG